MNFVEFFSSLCVCVCYVMGNKVLFHRIRTIDVWILFASSNCATHWAESVDFAYRGNRLFLLQFLSIFTPFTHYYYRTTSIFNDWTFQLCITILFNEFVRWSTKNTHSGIDMGKQLIYDAIDFKVEEICIFTLCKSSFQKSYLQHKLHAYTHCALLLV